MQLRILFLLMVFSMMSSHILGQNTAAKIKAKTLIIDSCIIILDPHTIIPNSVKIKTANHTFENINVQNNKINLTPSVCDSLSGMEVLVQYRTFGFNVEKPYFVIDSSLLSFKEKSMISVYEYKPADNKNNIIDAKGLDYRGSFSRGLSIGNSQSLVLNSNFDLQLIGDLGNGLKVVAAISDENLPIQAQGNTQQLQEFDKVFIQVSKDKTSVISGDYELRKPNGYFMNYFKKLKGISVATEINTGKDSKINTKGSFAISRGKFARQTIATKEGNQGPYRLQGNNNERFIIVLAGTEKVYFNGILLTRGYDYDYIMEYNRAEITFSPTRVIARDSRVIIEFEYTDISYLRSLYATQTEFDNGKWKFNFNFYSEQDSKNATGDVQLDSMDIDILKNAGDDFRKSSRSSIRPLSTENKQEANRILYAGIKDPLDPNNIILRFTENLDSASYSAVFSEVGTNLGDYIIDNTANRNGRVYRYVGKNMGSYLPVITLIPPEKRQMITANAKYELGKTGHLFAEVAMSNVDINRLSTIGNDNNTGLSSHISLEKSVKLDSAATWTAGANLKHEFIDKNFVALNPFRPQEFVRDWNIGGLNAIGNENLVLSNLFVKSKKGITLNYGFNTFDKTAQFSGRKHVVTGIIETKKWYVRAFLDQLSSTSTGLNQNTQFSRPNINISRKLGKNNDWQIGIVYDGEKNSIRNQRTDTLKRESFAFDHYKWFAASDFNKDFAIKLMYSYRDDFFAKKEELSKASVAHELELAGKWLASANSDLQWSVIGRQLEVKDASLLPNDVSKKTILGKLDYIFSAFNQGIRSTTSYNTNSGQEPKIEYVFQKVEVGQGDYVLVDSTRSSNLRAIQDFSFAPNDIRRDYIRLTLTNNEFIRTNNIELNQSINIEPSKFKKPIEGKKFTKSYLFLSKFAALSNIRINKKQMDDANVSLTSFLNFGIQDTSLVAYNSQWSNTLFFNRGNVKYDIQLGNRNNQNRTVLVGSIEDRGLLEYFFRMRWNMWSKMDIFFNLENSLKTYSSQAFPDRNLDIQINKIRPEISVRPTSNTRIVAKYTYQERKQQILTQDFAKINDLTTEFALRKANLYSLDFSVSYVDIKFTGIPNSPLEYDMLEGLKNGRNFLWNAIFTKRIAKNIDLSINYEGRKTANAPTVHIGRAQIKATF